MKSRGSLTWRWSLRDLRERWKQVVGIALIIALGVALYSGLSSTVPWRTKSFDQSYTMLNMYDLKLTLTPGSYLASEGLGPVIAAVPHADWIEDVDYRLRLPTTVDASTPDTSIVVSGEIIGVDVARGGPYVNKLHVPTGRALNPGDVAQLVCIVEYNFGQYYDLTPGDRAIQVSGGYALQPVGLGLSAEHFMVIEEGSGVLGAYAHDRFAALFVPLSTAQAIAGLPGMVNQALIAVPEELSEEDLDRLEAELQSAVEAAFPQVGVSLEKGSENFARRVLYDDIASDQEIFEFISFLLLFGAAMGAFILIGRMVDAQRREIGIHMALGVPPRRIARRYLLIGTQIAALGMILGALLGLLINQPLGEQVKKLLPLPYFDAAFQAESFAQGALIGVLIPFLAVLYPVWRAVRVPPVDAIQTGYLVSKGGGLAPWLARLPWPGSSLTLFPVRSLSRGLRRTLMTVVGLSMAIIVLMTVIGLIDTFRETLDAGRQEMEQDAPERSLVLLDDFYPLSDPNLSQIVAHDAVAQAVPAVILPGQLAGDETFDVMLQLLDLDNDLWTPTLLRGSRSAAEPGIIINQKAADDLGVDVGDRVTLRHPYRESRHAWRMSASTLPVLGIHRDIMRTAVYMDIQDAHVIHLEGTVNSLHVNPSAGIEIGALRRALSQIQGVASVRQVSSSLIAIKDLLDQYIGVFQVIQFVVLLMAFAIAFNTTHSNIEERRRDIATMFAFGARVRTVLRMAVIENLITGVLGTALGIGLGWLILNTALLSLFEHDAPDLSPLLTVYPATFGWAVLIGVVVVALTPLLMVRTLLKMDIPSTLRVIE